MIAAFVATDWPRELIALAAGGVLLVNRRIASGDVLRQVDGNLLLLIMGLFVNAALAATGLPQSLPADLRGVGLDLAEPLPLVWVGALLSDIVGNNPAVLLLAPLAPRQRCRFVNAFPRSLAGDAGRDVVRDPHRERGFLAAGPMREPCLTAS